MKKKYENIATRDLIIKLIDIQEELKRRKIYR